MSVRLGPGSISPIQELTLAPDAPTTVPLTAILMLGRLQQRLFSVSSLLNFIRGVPTVSAAHHFTFFPMARAWELSTGESVL